MDSFVIQPDGLVEITYVDPSPLVSVEVLQPATVGVVTVQGPQGPPGPTYDGVAWWYGVGDPGTIIGSKPGDFYVDSASGNIFILGD